MKVLFIGDIYMAEGRKAFDRYYDQVKQDQKPQLVIVNGENIADGNGLSETIYKDYLKRGVNIFTLGNHTFTRKDYPDVLALPYVARPANYGPGTPGNDYVLYKYNDKTVAVINLLGRIFMRDPIDNPLTKADQLLATIKADYIIVDFHAEATSEKLALAHHLDGRVDAIVGTHTHVPTADEMRLPGGTLYITDVGMTGVKYGIIGGEVAQGIRKFIRGVPERVKPETSGLLQFNAVIMDLDQKTIQRINIREDA